MSFNIATNSITKSNNSITNSVIHILGNTACIVCGTAFQAARVGKIYCSPRCKQFGYNHKDQISRSLKAKSIGILAKPQIFFIEDFNSYTKNQRILKTFRELSKKKQRWELANQELKEKERLEMPISNYFLESYSNKKLTENEETDLYNAETELDEQIIDLNPKELNIEQWSFIKSLYPSLDNISFFELVCSLSVDFLSQLTISEESNIKNLDKLVIKNKFLNHCNLIASGVINFKKQIVGEI